MEYRGRYKVKKEITNTLGTIELRGDTPDVIKRIKDMEKMFKKDGYFKFRIDEESDRYEDYSYSILIGTRLETDEEFSKRVADSKKRSAAAKIAAKTKAAKKEERELSQYKKLHEKYKDKI
jgi:hypothetical protein